MNRVHFLLDKYDVKCDYDNIFGVKGTRWLRNLKLSGNDQILLYEYIMQIEFLNTEIKNSESKMIYQASKNESVKILMSMTGIDYFSAMLIASEIGDITRFDTPEKLVSWAGLCPSIHQSGNSLYMGRMKDGNKKIRWILIQAANTAARKDERLRRFYLRIAKRHGHHIAVTHVANKMMTIVTSAFKSNLMATSVGFLPFENKAKACESLDNMVWSLLSCCCSFDLPSSSPCDPVNFLIIDPIPANDICTSCAISRIDLPCL